MVQVAQVQANMIDSRSCNGEQRAGGAGVGGASSTGATKHDRLKVLQRRTWCRREGGAGVGGAGGAGASKHDRLKVLQWRTWC